MNSSSACSCCGASLLVDGSGPLCASCLTVGGTVLTGTAHPGVGALSRIRYFGDYEIEGEIASGGMGVVYLARQVSLNRAVALKMIRSGALASEAEVQRFRTEAEAAANLDCPNIVPVYEVGEHDGQHYFSMRLVEGGHLGELNTACASRDIKWQRRSARLIATIARAVHHAHQHGVLHRDIKPTNILLDETGEPHLTDFGLAKLLSGSSSLTVSTDVLGTPSYMAPELAAGKAQTATTAADIYSLGAVLYELLAGRPPFHGGTVLEVLEMARTTSPPGLRTLNPAIEKDLQTICQKCLEKEPSRRFGTAGALAEDLNHFLNNEPVMASPPSTAYRMRKFLRRHRLATVAGCVLGLCLLGLIAGAGWVARDKTARVSLARSQVESALEDVEMWLARDDLRQAASALKRAEGFAAGIDQEPIAGRVRQWRQDIDLLEKLDGIREAGALLTGPIFDRQSTRDAYANALRPLGVRLDLPAAERGEVVRRLRASPISRQLAEAIDDWSVWAKEHGSALHWAASIDGDTGRNALRNAIATRDREAMRRLGEQAAINPLPPKSAWLLAHTLQLVKLLDESAAVLRASRMRYPNDFWLSFHWGYTLANFLERDDQAAAVREAGVALRPDSLAARINLASSLLRLKRVAEAESHVREALRIVPGDPMALTVLAEIAYLEKRTDEARKLLQSVVERAPGIAHAHFKLGLIHDVAHETQAALTEYREAVRLQDDAIYRNALGGLLAEIKELDEAELHYRAALKLNPGFSLARDSLRKMLLQRGRANELAVLEREWLEQRLPRNPATPLRLVDLSNHYNAALDHNWQDPKNNALHLGTLPVGVKAFAGVEFDVRGIVQLFGAELEKARPGFPDAVPGIRVDQSCRRIHVLHGTAWNVPHGTTIAEYVIHRGDGTAVTMPVVYAQHVKNWLSMTGNNREVTDAKIAWQAALPLLKDWQTTVYMADWENPDPAVPVTSIDFISRRSDAAPFLLAITLDP